jgi:hypothetical protein
MRRFAGGERRPIVASFTYGQTNLGAECGRGLDGDTQNSIPDFADCSLEAKRLPGHNQIDFNNGSAVGRQCASSVAYHEIGHALGIAHVTCCLVRADRRFVGSTNVLFTICDEIRQSWSVR